MASAIEVLLPISDIKESTVSASPGLLCATHTIRGENECPPSGEEAPTINLQTLFFRVIKWNDIKAQKTIVSEENDAGEKRTKLFRLTQVLSFDLVTDQFHLALLQGMETFQKWELNKLIGGDSFDLKSLEVSDARPIGDTGYSIATVSMTIKGADIVVDSCCGSAFEGAPFEDCTDAGNEPVPPAECGAYALNALVYDAANKTLTASTTDQPAATIEFFRWYYFPTTNSPQTILSETAAVITVTTPGTYRAIAVAGNCETDAEDFLLQDDCGNFSALISQDGDFIVVEPNRISTITWELDSGSGFTAIPDTDLIIRPTVTGTYRATVTSGDCEEIISIAVDLGDCDFAVSLADNAGILTATITGYTGGDTPTYTWLKDTGSGEVVITGAVSDTYTVLEPGNYIVEVELDTCTQRQNLVLLSNCYSFLPYIDYVIPSGGDVLLMSGHTGAPGPVTIEWDQIRNGVWTSIGTGASITTDQQGPVRLRAASENCVRETFSQACIDPSRPEYEERFEAIASQTVFTPTKVIFGSIVGLSQEDIGAKYELYRNGARLVYKHLADITHRSEWTINGANIQLNWPSNAGDIYVLVERYIP